MLKGVCMCGYSGVLNEARFHALEFIVSDEAGVVTHAGDCLTKLNSTDAGVAEELEARHQHHGLRGAHHREGKGRGCQQGQGSEGEELFLHAFSIAHRGGVGQDLVTFRHTGGPGRWYGCTILTSLSERAGFG